MKPFITLGETKTPDGARLSLHEREGEYCIKVNGDQLMSSGWTESELILSDEVCRFPKKIENPTVLIGGMGLGFSLLRVLEIVGKKSKVIVAELMPEVIEWNRELLQHVNGNLLDDPRVRIHLGDVFDCIAQAGPSFFDGILLDVDNGPNAFVQSGNDRLYTPEGLATIYKATKPGGRVSFWAADEAPRFPKQLRKVGFKVEEVGAKAHARAKRNAHWIYTGQK